jgi:hypothetical protein
MVKVKIFLPVLKDEELHLTWLEKFNSKILLYWPESVSANKQINFGHVIKKRLENFEVVKDPKTEKPFFFVLKRL